MVSIREINGEENQNIQGEFQDEGAPVDDIDMEAAEEPPAYNATTGSQHDDTCGFDFHIDQTLSPPLEPGPSRVSRIRQVVAVGPDSEPEGEEGADEPDEGACIWFHPDVASEADDDDDDGGDEARRSQLEDPRVARGEEAHRLETEQELDDLGMYRNRLPCNLRPVALMQSQARQFFLHHRKIFFFF